MTVNVLHPSSADDRVNHVELKVGVYQDLMAVIHCTSILRTILGTGATLADSQRSASGEGWDEAGQAVDIPRHHNRPRGIVQNSSRYLFCAQRGS